MGTVRVYATTYRRGDAADNQTHDLGRFPAAPAVGQVIHYSTTGNDDDSLAWHVDRVSWCEGTTSFGTPGEWHLEIALGAH
ncbi:hypothetical protein I5G63_gp046 [Mycobacterium phage Imvubu]|uniref:Uncharacterized protein n=1 Tax=Mycobacterium phage Imvubu TaxID=2686233 RepID=A0A6B9L7G6_9CAUD|nr:hypothetical protein I5G63_gp046 [Mycobacterium phage Imvubu]QHB37787.1 hypothetical protein PBI_IMVUBU_46 [Mycobacterium phage Imvubu]